MASKFGAEGKAVGVWSSDVGKQVKLYATTTTIIF